MTPSNFPQRFTLEPEKETSPPSASRTLRRETTFCPFYSFTRDHEVHATTVLNYSSDKATTCLLGARHRGNSAARSRRRAPGIVKPASTTSGVNVTASKVEG